jgi:hypothetical protein
MTQLTLFFILATLVEGIVEYAGDRIPTAYKQYAAALTAIALCVAYNADLLALIGLTTPHPYVGAIMTGIVLGRGSNYLHDFTSRFAPLKVSALRAAVATLEVPITKLPDEK